MYAIMFLYFNEDSHFFEIMLNTDLFIILGFLMIGLFFTIIYLVLDLPCCFSGSQNCFCQSCCGPSCYKSEIKVIDFYDPIEPAVEEIDNLFEKNNSGGRAMNQRKGLKVVDIYTSIDESTLI